jgi:hypothetical protein
MWEDTLDGHPVWHPHTMFARGGGELDNVRSIGKSNCQLIDGREQKQEIQQHVIWQGRNIWKHSKDFFSLFAWRKEENQASVLGINKQQHRWSAADLLWYGANRDCRELQSPEAHGSGDEVSSFMVPCSSLAPWICSNFYGLLSVTGLAVKLAMILECALGVFCASYWCY